MIKNKIAIKVVDNVFNEVVENTPDIANGYHHGLHAIESADKDAIRVKENRRLSGSVNIDKEVKDKYPNDPRWDYALCYDNKVCFVEVHPACTKNIDEMIKKKRWLVDWLKNNAPRLDSFPSCSPKFCWAATESGVHISAQASYKRKLAQLGLIPQRPIVLG